MGPKPSAFHIISSPSHTKSLCSQMVVSGVETPESQERLSYSFKCMMSDPRDICTLGSRRGGLQYGIQIFMTEKLACQSVDGGHEACNCVSHRMRESNALSRLRESMGSFNLLQRAPVMSIRGSRGVRRTPGLRRLKRHINLVSLFLLYRPAGLKTREGSQSNQRHQRRFLIS